MCNKIHYLFNKSFTGRNNRDNRMEIIRLINERRYTEQYLKSLIYGSIEIREKDGRRYIYVHYREDGISLTKYAGEFSENLNNIIIENNITARSLKKTIRGINKKLKELGYVDEELSDKVALNIDFARRHLADTIYKQAMLEGVATTYLDTQTIIEGGKVNDMTAEDVMKVVNLKHAWDFILNKDVILSPTNFSLLCEVNKFIEEGFYYNAGIVRSTPVSIGGTNWKPEIPIEYVVKEELTRIIDNTQLIGVDMAIELLLYVMKRQIFIDGNKRTAVIFANHFLISNGLGIMAIPNEKIEEYKKLLIAYYEGRDELSIKKFLKEQCFISLS